MNVQNPFGLMRACIYLASIHAEDHDEVGEIAREVLQAFEEMLRPIRDPDNEYEIVGVKWAKGQLAEAAHPSPAPQAEIAVPVAIPDEQNSPAVEKAMDRFYAAGPTPNALENCRLFAARHRKEEWAKTILRFCAEGGATGSPLRASQQP